VKNVQQGNYNGMHMSIKKEISGLENAFHPHIEGVFQADAAECRDERH
jgi:hypothetical protein